MRAKEQLVERAALEGHSPGSRPQLAMAAAMAPAAAAVAVEWTPLVEWRLIELWNLSVTIETCRKCKNNDSGRIAVFYYCVCCSAVIILRNNRNSGTLL